jgi:SAM-dependent methyltransferase
MKRIVAIAGAVAAGGAIAVAAARPPLKRHLAEGTLPGRSGSWVNSYLGRPGYRLMAEVLELGPEDDMLDVACGWGEFLVVHARTACRVAGIDWSEEKVALARERLADRIVAGTADVVHGDAVNLPWDGNTFSAVTCMDAFPFFTDPDLVITEMLRVLRPGGRTVMQIGMRWPDGPPKHMLHPRSDVVDVADEASVRALFENAGFVEVSMVYGPASATRAGAVINHILASSDEVRVVRAVKPSATAQR